MQEHQSSIGYVKYDVPATPGSFFSLLVSNILLFLDCFGLISYDNDVTNHNSIFGSLYFKIATATSRTNFFCFVSC